MVNSNLVELYLDKHTLERSSDGNQKTSSSKTILDAMASKLLSNNQPKSAAGQDADLVKDLVNDLVTSLNKANGNLDELPMNGSPPTSEHDEQDKDSINNDDVSHDEDDALHDEDDDDDLMHSDLKQQQQLNNELMHHNGRNSISSGTSSIDDRSDDDDDEDEVRQPSVEHERIQEYLNRKDTAVVYPVDVSELTNQTSLNELSINKLTNNSLSDQQPIKRKKTCKYSKECSTPSSSSPSSSFAS